ncbi:polyamine oxidase Ecym_4580 [Eremothecium cymbalariae DBVPG|uniref:Amine oxidase domain-containing protein n=1 Tax=Eremothecium cymbalariae (strain CBS 270.75 / DBVPG 7215 / KCTC 17166 / NRRL Y-17582) TaxID=931890 RepID=G8JS91_ERECY|nr:hypothetical protein Ecym_4580 [Eremothecium cymbalariae DBVPG\
MEKILEKDSVKCAVIVGAGIAGLKTASELYASGVKNCMLLEARPRVGGRLFTVKSEVFPERAYDLGGSWHHHTLENGLFLEELSLPKSERADFVFDIGSVIYMEHDGTLMNCEKVGLDALLNQLMQYIESELFGQEAEDVTFFEIFLRYIYEKHTSLSDRQIEILAMAAQNLEFWHGVDWKMLSGRWSEMDQNRRDAMVLNYDKIVGRIQRSFPEDWIKLNTEVRQIKRVGDEVHVTTNDGAVYRTEFCVVTIPRTVLALSLQEEKRMGRIEFIPPLNESISSKINKMHFGFLGKLILEFDKCTWENRCSNIFKAGIQKVHIDKEVRAARDFESFAKKIDSMTQDFKHYSDYPVAIVNMMAIAGIPSLIIFTKPPSTEYIENSCKAEIAKTFKPLIDIVIKAIGSPFDCIIDLESKITNNSDLKNPILKNVITTSWAKDPYSLGGYSACHAGDDPKGLVESINKGQDSRIRFAGEHTVFKSLGCSYGAWESGIREAQYILKQQRQ